MNERLELLELISATDQRLRMACSVVDWDEIAGLAPVIARMKELMVEHKGVGLAAPQVGLLVRLFIMSASGRAEDAQVFINPVILKSQGEATDMEGCLSLPARGMLHDPYREMITRAKRIKVEAIDEKGVRFTRKLQGYEARIFQHERDHLDGIMIDRQHAEQSQ